MTFQQRDYRYRCSLSLFLSFSHQFNYILSKESKSPGEKSTMTEKRISAPCQIPRNVTYLLRARKKNEYTYNNLKSRFCTICYSSPLTLEYTLRNNSKHTYTLNKPIIFMGNTIITKRIVLQTELSAPTSVIPFLHSCFLPVVYGKANTPSNP